MKNLPKAMSNMFGGHGSGRTASGDFPTIKMSMREYEDMQLKVGQSRNQKGRQQWNLGKHVYGESSE